MPITAGANTGCQLLQKMNPLVSALLDDFIRPDADLDFTDVPFLEQQHAEPRLPDAAAHCLRKFAGEQLPVPFQPGPFHASAQFKLTQERLPVDSDSH